MTLMALTVLVPLGLAAALALPGLARALGLRLAPVAAMPAALLVVIGSPGDRIEVEWILLGSVLRLEELGLVFLAFGSLIWLVAGLYGAYYHRDDPGAHRVGAFFCLAMAGSFTLTLAGDAITFHAGYAVMTFSAYGLIVHSGTSEAHRAGKVYIAMAVAAEAALLAALILATVAAGSLDLAAIPAGIAAGDAVGLTVALFVAGFGVKAGLLGLHMWLPLAHPAAPTPSSAALSGVMIKAGLLGMLVFLPIGAIEIEWAAALLVGLGLAGAFLAAGFGALHSSAKVALAYSSVSQIGIMIVAIAVALADPGLRDAALSAVALYALMHGLTKAALFLSVEIAGRTTGAVRIAVVTGAALLGISLAAAPVTAGAIAKQGVKDVVAAGTVAPDALVFILTLTGAATAAVMGRLVLNLSGTGYRGLPVLGLAVPTAVLALAALIGAWAAPALFPIGPRPELPGTWTALWPVLTGVAAFGLYRLLGSTVWPRLAQFEIRPGDLLVPVLFIAVRFAGLARSAATALRARAAGATAQLAGLVGLAPEPSSVDRIESDLERWEIAGLALIVVAVIVGAALW